jgi:dienelactone hydrolase
MMTMISRKNVSFESAGNVCRGWLYLPAAPAGVPCVVMGHGTTGTMSLGLDRYARRFVAAGFSALAFDYRHFGSSEGEPRQVINIGEQLADWRAAVAYAQSLPQIDSERIALWGTSLSAGHVVSVAAANPAIAAVVAQLPFFGIQLRGSSPRTAAVTVKLFSAAIADTVGGLLHLSPKTVAMVGAPGTVAVFTGAQDYEVCQLLAASAPDWRNELAARSLWSLMRYRPANALARVSAPLLVCVADADTAASVPLALQASAQAPRAEIRRYPGGHFGAYTGAVFEQMVTDETEFLRHHLLAPSPDSPATHPNIKASSPAAGSLS